MGVAVGVGDGICVGVMPVGVIVIVTHGLSPMHANVGVIFVGVGILVFVGTVPDVNGNCKGTR